MFHIPISAIKYLCAKYNYFFYIGDKRLRGHPSSEETTYLPPLEEGEIHPRQAEQEEEDVVEIGTTTGDRDVVDPDHFTSESAQILIGEIMGCNRDLENIHKSINDFQKKKNEEHHCCFRERLKPLKIPFFCAFCDLKIFTIF
ncbi:hypothetical protein AB205_0061870 [Aquarana catesbeiana]|uniref:Uncharacterized protein n=1 Tax=Aquarana catesbeiana TaxID=8400 RepID=A0A2G9Q9D6_AQUCT|nr:hypothetical protein AB205_0061870 [Aquarana catesbeiana]